MVLFTCHYWLVTLDLSLLTCNFTFVTLQLTLLYCTIQDRCIWFLTQSREILIFQTNWELLTDRHLWDLEERLLLKIHNSNLEILKTWSDLNFSKKKDLNFILLSDWIKNSSQTPTYKGDTLIWSFLRHIAFTNMPYYINKRIKKALYFTFLMQVSPFNHLSAGVCCCSNVLKFLKF